ncbi:hypothetical protein TNCT_290531 [Trichonephila clavata]|uniref:Uncharacterized protein n=1 Tax=Trichonephila clavata TaxID=2740835 RepID=A0A8X6HV07_TRICU|nr:hypothetical protein TNCT_290531 [Trichonephila clavata]
MVSRGASVEHLLRNKLWWLGPEWMGREEGPYNHYSTKEIPTYAIECEKMKIVVFSTVTDSNWTVCLPPKYSSFQKLLRVVAWCLRFVNILRSLSRV